MSQRGVKRFLDEMQKDPSLRAAFNNAVAQLAQDNGFDVDSHDVNDSVKAHYQPKAEPPKPETDFSKLKPIVTTQAIGEEDFKGKNPNKGTPSVTLAIGEEDKKPAPKDDEPRFSVTCAIGEEDKKPAPQDDEPRMTTMALGEEGNPPLPKPETPRATTLALGEEGKKPRPSPGKQFSAITLAIGEDGVRKPSVGVGGGGSIPRAGDDKPVSRKEPQITTAAVGEEDGQKPNTVKRYIIPREDENGNTGPDITSMALGEEEPKNKKPGTPKP